MLPAAEEMELSDQGEEGTHILGGIYRDRSRTHWDLHLGSASYHAALASH